MLPETLLYELRARGVELQAHGNRLRFRPGEAVPDDLRAALAVHKAELLALVREATSAPPHETLSPGAPDFAETVARLLNLPLDRFAQADRALEVRVPWHPETLWLVPQEADGERLVGEGISRGRIWTAGELADLLSIPGMTTDRARHVALVKLGFDGEVTEVRRRVPEPGDQAPLPFDDREAPPVDLSELLHRDPDRRGRAAVSGLRLLGDGLMPVELSVA